MGVNVKRRSREILTVLRLKINENIVTLLNKTFMSPFTILNEARTR